MGRAKIELYVEMLEKAKAETLAAAGKVGQSQALYQGREATATPLWLLGHMANALNGVTLIWVFCGEGVLTREQRKPFAPDFAGGAPPTSDATAYPPWQDVIQCYNAVMTKVIEEVRAMEDAWLPKPLKGEVPEPLRAFFPSNGATLNQMVSHDAYHRGQIALLTRLAG